MKHFLYDYFSIAKKQTTIKTELLAGVTTFLAMAYILVVNPIILSQSGMDAGAVFTATALSAFVATFLMGIYAKLPIGLAPGMGMNSFFTYSIVLTMGYTWQQALGAIFISGLIFILISVSGIRKRIVKAIPNSQKAALSAGIGLFIAFIGLKNAGLIVSHEATFVTLGNLREPAVLLAIFGLLVTLILMAKKVYGAIFLGMVITTIVGIVGGLNQVPTALVGPVPSISPIFGAVFTIFNDLSFLNLNFVIVIFSVLFIDFFETTGFLVAIAEKSGFARPDGTVENLEKALVVDAVSITAGSVLGTSSVTTFGESLAGIGVGGRTGLTAITVSICFLLSLFFYPVLSVVTGNITAPALIIVGSLMAGSLKEIDFDDITVGFPAFATIIFTVLTYSIATGIAIGFILYPILMACTKRTKEVDPVLWGLMSVFVIYFIVK